MLTVKYVYFFISSEMDLAESELSRKVLIKVRRRGDFQRSFVRPKMEQPNSTKEFRVLSCTNYSYGVQYRPAVVPLHGCTV
jgi:hypothetical protein